MIRPLLGGAAVLLIAGGAVTYVLQLPMLLSVYLVVEGVLIVGGLALERGRYRPPVPPGGSWEPTEERFLDPASGHLIEVQYDRDSGTRRYEDLGPAPGSRR